MKLLSRCCILLLMVTASSPTVTSRNSTTVGQLVKDPRVAQALDWLRRNADWVTQEQIRITEIPAPPFQEAQRAAYIAKLLKAYGLRVRTDDAGNVVGERSGGDDVVLAVAHLDTVFPAGTEVRVRQNGGRLWAPGISDNGTGLATLVAVARALHEASIKTRMTIVFAADVGEEGEGNLRGMRKLVEDYRGRLRYVIAVDGSATDHVTTSALASRRVELSVLGPGGHSWSDFGLPNPIHAVSRGVAKFVRMKLPQRPRTTFNVGVIEGGMSVNAIPARASIKVDMRSESEAELERLATALREAIQAGVDEEITAARERGVAESVAKLEIRSRILGIRPGGELAEGSPLLAALRDADRHLGNRSRLERASTDANVPLSLGIQAIALGGGGRAGGAHSMDEWYEPAGREMGLQRVLLTLLGVAQVEGPTR